MSTNGLEREDYFKVQCKTCGSHRVEVCGERIEDEDDSGDMVDFTCLDCKSKYSVDGYTGHDSFLLRGKKVATSRKH